MTGGLFYLRQRRIILSVAFVKPIPPPRVREAPPFTQGRRENCPTVSFVVKDCYFNKIGVIVKFRNAHINPSVFWSADILEVFLPPPLQPARKNH